MVDDAEARRFLDAVSGAAIRRPTGPPHGGAACRLLRPSSGRPGVRPTLRRERGHRRGARPQPAGGCCDTPSSPARHHRRTAPRGTTDRGRRRPTERAAAVPVCAHRAVRRSERAAARSRNVRTDRRGAQGHRSASRVAVRTTRPGRAGDRAAAVPANCDALGRHRGSTSRSGGGARLARRRRHRPAKCDRHVLALSPPRARSRRSNRQPDGRGRPRSPADRMAPFTGLDRPAPRRPDQAGDLPRGRERVGSLRPAILATSCTARVSTITAVGRPRHSCVSPQPSTTSSRRRSLRAWLAKPTKQTASRFDSDCSADRVTCWSASSWRPRS